MSARTVVYKGLLLADQVGVYYKDLQDDRTVSALALVHQRFSTNTFPEWPLAHPYRMIAHNGEINTVKGNFNWMRARDRRDEVAVLGDDLPKLYPLIYEGQSDTASFDNCARTAGDGRLPARPRDDDDDPEAWEQHTLMDDNRRAFYEYHAAMMEPWDGPAAMAFTDGRQIGATLDRNGLRPARYIVTDDDLVIMASEAGVLPIPENKIVKKWRLQPGKMFLIDLEHGRIIDDKELKDNLANAKPYKSWIDACASSSTRSSRARKRRDGAPRAAALLDRQQAFGYTQEDLKFLMAPMAQAGEEARRLDGQRLAAGGHVQQEQDAVQLLQAAVRAGHEPADRPDPRKHGDVAGVVHRSEAEPAGHEQHQPADAPRSVAAGARLRRHREDARDRSVHGGKFKPYELNICYPVAWGKEGIEARWRRCARKRSMRSSPATTS
jgi:glutamate synthase (NADPH/NADH) large chain